MMRIQTKMQMKIDSFWLVKLAIVYLVVWCISPPLSYGMIYRLLAFVAIAYVGAYFLYTNRLKLERYYISIIGIVLYIVLISFVTGDSINKRLSILITACVIFCSAVFREKSYTRKRLFFIVGIVLALCVCWNICSLIGIAEVPNIMRLLAKNSGISQSYAKRGIGGFGYLYTVLLMLPIGIDCTLNKKIQKTYRIIAVGFVLTSYVLVFQSQYFLAIILSILLLAVYFTMKIKKIIFRSTLLLLLFSAFVIAYINADKILLYLMDINDARSIDLKLQSIYELLVVGDDIQNSEFSVRAERYIKSINYTLTHPLIGGLRYGVTGNHSHILDFFAQYGFVIGGLYFVLIMLPFKKVKNYPVGYTCMVVYILMLLLNTLAFSFSVVVYIILPLYYYRLEES